MSETAVTGSAATRGTATPAAGATGINALSALVTAGDLDGLVAFLRPLDEKARRALVTPLRDLRERMLRAEATHWQTGSAVPWEKQYGVTLAAGFGVFGGATAVAQWVLTHVRDRWGFSGAEGLPEAVLTVLADRRPDFLAELPEVLVKRLGPRYVRFGMWRSIDRVAALTGFVFPAEPGTFVSGWALHWFQMGREEGARRAALMREDPRLAEYLPLVFQSADADAYFGACRHELNPDLAALAAADPALRTILLDGVLGRFALGGTVHVLGPFLELWRRLEPTAAEVAQRHALSVSLIASCISPVAGQLQADLARADAAGSLDFDAALDVARTALGRPEKKIVLAQLAWLGQLVERRPERALEIVAVATGAYSHPAADLRLRAEKFVAKHLPPDTPGAVVPGRIDYGFSDEPGPYVPSAPPEPIGSPAELATQFDRLWRFGPDDPLALERVLAAFVEFAHDDIKGLRSAFAPIRARGAGGRGNWTRFQPGDFDVPKYLLPKLLDAIGLPDSPQRIPPPDAEALGPRGWSYRAIAAQGLGRRLLFDSPDQLLNVRIAEIAARVGTDGTRRLVSTPTEATGAIDPRVLAGRIARAEAEGWQPWPMDLEQALLRVSPLTGPVAAGSVDAGSRDADSLGTGPLTSKAGRRLTAWLAPGGAGADATSRPAFPEVELIPAFPGHDSRDVRTVPALAPMTVQAPGVLDGEPHGLVDFVRQIWRTRAELSGQREWALCRPTVLPQHRDLIALSLVREWGGHGCVFPGALPILAEADGGTTALIMAISAGFCHGGALESAQAVDAAVILAQRGHLDGAALGTDLGWLTTAESGAPGRFVGSLRGLAVAGAARQAWDACVELVPVVLPPLAGKPPPGTADLLHLAAELAEWLGIRTGIPELASFAAARGARATAVVTAARRLQAVVGQAK